MVGVQPVNKIKPISRRSFGLDTRNAIIQTLLSLQINGELPHGSISKVSRQFDTDSNTVSTIFNNHKWGKNIKDKRYLS